MHLRPSNPRRSGTPGLISLLAVLALFVPLAASAESSWWKGNLHTHSLWSDGDDYPEMIAQWYKDNGYHFLALSDHNVLADSDRWIDIAKSKGADLAFAKYRERWGQAWVETREQEGKTEVRLKKLQEWAPRVQEPGRFLMIPAEEVTSRVHVNVINIRELILPYTAPNQKESDGIIATLQRVLDRVWQQRQRTGVPMFAHVNHPNFQWALTAEELAQLNHEKFFEVYNGHPSTFNEGDAQHASTDRIWDILLSQRLGKLGKDLVYGVGNDDAHHYHGMPKKDSRPGRGFVMVRAGKLDTDSLIEAMEKGDFYASSGVLLKTLAVGKASIELEIADQPGVEYITEFIGTDRGFDDKSQPVLDGQGKKVRTTRTYSGEVGRVLAQVSGPTARYEFSGRELYVRAKITSTKVMNDPSVPGEVERAWIQPVVPGSRTGP